MSWSGYMTARYDDAEAALEAIAVSPDSDAPEQVAQVAAAKASALSLIKSNVVVSDPSEDVSVSITGHASATIPTSAATNTVSVVVSQVVRQTVDA